MSNIQDVIAGAARALGGAGVDAGCVSGATLKHARTEPTGHPPWGCYPLFVLGQASMRLLALAMLGARPFQERGESS